MNRTRCRCAALVLIGCLVVGCTRTPSGGAAIPGTTTGAGLEIGFRSESDPPTSGDNAFEVTVSKDGTPVDGAEVTALFSMPAMPAMNMPEMHTTVTLQAASDGRYRGTGQLSMAGTWNVRIIVKRDGRELGTQTLSLVAK